MVLAQAPCPKASAMDLATLSFELLSHPDMENTVPVARFSQFPLGGDGPFLCTQGIGGRLTHFFPESYHAFDLRCAIGTPILAMADGVVAEAQHICRCTSISVGQVFITCKYVSFYR